jgi:hypothetical protein
VQPGPPRQARPPRWTEHGAVGMARGWEGGREEGERRSRTPGQPEFPQPVGGAGHHAPAISYVEARTGAGPATRAQMDTRTERRRQAGVPGNDQDEAPCAADPCEVTTERGTVRRAVMAEDDAAKPAGQSHRRWAGVGHAVGVGEQPQSRQATAWAWARRRRTRPG